MENSCSVIRNTNKMAPPYIGSPKKSLAFTWIINDLWNRGKCRTGAVVNDSFTLIKAASYLGPQWFRNVFELATDLQVRATKGSITVAKFGMNFRAKFIVRSTERSSFIVVLSSAFSSQQWL